MSKRLQILSMCLIGMIAGTALAHQGVQNAAVQARMHNMMEIVDDLKIMGDMAKGKTAFDAEAAKAAAKDIARHASETPSFFAMNETDPKSEAKPIIWDQFGDFTAKSRKLEAVALDVSDEITDVDSLRTGMSEIAQTCKGCHAVYRE